MSLESWTIDRRVEQADREKYPGKNNGSNNGSTLYSGATINLLFPGWLTVNERVTVISPHDDDAFLGAAFAMMYALQNKAAVDIVVVTDGSKGFTSQDISDNIVHIRAKEREDAAAILSPDIRVIPLNFPDGDLADYCTMQTRTGDDGLVAQLTKTFKILGTTRVLVPSCRDDHTDHQYVNRAARLARYHANEGLFPAIGKKTNIRSFMEYFVYFAPCESEMANLALRAPEEAFRKKLDSINAFSSQKDIIQKLIQKISEGGNGELYREVPAAGYDFNRIYNMYFTPDKPA